ELVNVPRRTRRRLVRLVPRGAAGAALVQAAFAEQVAAAQARAFENPVGTIEDAIGRPGHGAGRRENDPEQVGFRFVANMQAALLAAEPRKIEPANLAVAMQDRSIGKKFHFAIEAVA